MAGPRTTSFGRFLSTLGWVWMLAAVVTALLLPEAERVPFLPALGFYLLGKTLAAIGRRDTPEEPEGPIATGPSDEPEWETTPLDDSEGRPVRRRNEYLDDRVDRAAMSQEPDQSFEIPDLEEAILETPPPMTSEEMVAEARRRFQPRPPDYEG